MSRARRILFHLVAAPFAVLLCVLVRAIRPIKRVKIGTFRATRFGHFTIDSVLTWRKLRARSDRPIALVWLPEVPSNEFWATLVRRHFFVWNWFKYVDFWNRRLPFGGPHILAEHRSDSNDVAGVSRSAPERFGFLPEEDERAKDWLRSKGWHDGEPIVCLAVRDDAYLKTDPTLKGVRDWSYHEYRNSDIADFELAVEYLLAEGAWVFRMGKVMNAAAPFAHPRFVDYAFDASRSDFLDVWLFSNCDLCITTAFGADGICCAYDIQMVEVNSVQPYLMRHWTRAVFAPKRLYWRDSGRELTLAEQIENSFTNVLRLGELGIEMRSLSPEQIRAAVSEGWRRLRGTWTDTAEIAELKARFWSSYRRHPAVRELSPWYCPDYHPAAAWLRDTPDYVIGPPAASDSPDT